MDSLTQLALGAAVGEAALGRKVGNKAIVWGAIVGTLPDLDVFIPFDDAVKDFTYHRSATHSLLVLAVLTPLLTWLITRIHPDSGATRGRWALAIYLVLATHVLLDSFTAYGTQIFWPLVTTPMAWSTIFIIDPAYTLPLLIGVIGALCMTRASDRGHLLNRFGLVASSAYLAWTLVAKTIVDSAFEDSLRGQNIGYQKMFSTPTPFNSLLWRAVARDEDAYYEGFYSLLDEGERIEFRRYHSADFLLQGLENHWPVQRLRWFSKGFYSVRQDQQDVVISDLRMGLEPNYAFSFKIAEIGNPHPHPVTPVQLDTGWDRDTLKRSWYRIWDETVQLHAGPP